MLVTIGFLVQISAHRAFAAADTQPATPSTQPTSQYDKFNDVTYVWIRFAGIRIGYPYEGQQAKPWFDRLTLWVEPGIPVNGDSLIFLVDGSKRVHLQLDDKHSAAVSAEWLSQFVGAKSIEVNTGGAVVGTSLTDSQLVSIRALLEKAGFYSQARQKAEIERKALWAPGKRVAYILDTGGMMLNCFWLARAQLAQNVLDHPVSGGTQLLIASDDQGKVDVVSLAYPPVPEDASLLLREHDFAAKHAHEYLAKLLPRGTPNIAAALDAAIARNVDAVVFVTTNRSEYMQADIPSIKAKLLSSKIPLNVLVFSHSDDERFKALANATKGTYRRIDAGP